MRHTMSDKSSLEGFTELVEIMARLRDPEKGCPWDLKQDFKTIAPYTLEEAYEVADAIEQEIRRQMLNVQEAPASEELEEA